MDYQSHNQEEQSILFTIDASKAENTDQVRMQLTNKMNCSIGFFANALKAAMKQDEHLKQAVVVALMDDMIKEADELDTLLSNLAKSN